MMMKVLAVAIVLAHFSGLCEGQDLCYEPGECRGSLVLDEGPLDTALDCLRECQASVTFLKIVTKWWTKLHFI